jgi:hypothetical protein
LTPEKLTTPAAATLSVGRRPSADRCGSDEFYLPLAGFHTIDRPGPNLKIFARR